MNMPKSSKNKNNKKKSSHHHHHDGDRHGQGDRGDGDSSSSSDDSFSSDSDDEFLTSQQQQQQQVGGGGKKDREAMVRKKLLENFYGKAAFVDNQQGNGDGDSDDDDSSDDDDDDDDQDDGPKGVGGSGGRRRGGKSSSSSIDDLDSPNFDAVRHTELHVLNDNVHPMLELEESLAGQVRTLDSTMQTLVYENYSRFIEATDAIKSIGVNVQANQSNLQKLHTSVTNVADTARSIELHCGPLRDELVEKIRVKRLLQRLDSLLKLPTTLRTSISSGKYRWATKSYLTAYSILSKHSAGFESLQRIETECYDIMVLMLADVKSKLVHWSGIDTNLTKVDSNGSERSSYDDDDGISRAVPAEAADANGDANDADEYDDPPDPPRTVSEIFECAGTPTLIVDHQRMKEHQAKVKAASAASSSSSSSPKEEEPPSSPVGIDRATSMVEFDPGLTVQECKDMSLNACLRLFERFLDTHHIELQEHMLSSMSSPSSDNHQSSNSFAAAAAAAIGDDTTAALLQTGTATSQPTGGSSGQLIPTNVLDSILEAAALYSMTFPSDVGGGICDQLSQFVSMAFYAFLQHVRGELLEMSIQAYPKDLRRLIEKADSYDESESGMVGSTEFDGSGNIATAIDDGSAADAAGNHDEDDQQDSDEKAYEQVSAATTMLLESVRQLSSGLSLPEIAVSADLASSLMEQTVKITESMVKKKVDQKFYALRIRVIEDCLTPFCRKCLQQSEGQGAAADYLSKSDDRRMQMVQMATVALSDAMQLVDDTVRSILAPATGNMPSSSSSSTSDDTMMLKAAVEQSTKAFSNWLAGAIESIAGCESSDSSHTVNVFPDPADGTISAEESQKILALAGTLSSLSGVGAVGDGETDGLSKIVENCMSRMLVEVESMGSASSSTRSEFILAVSEMCRQAERTVMDDIDSSISTHLGKSSKQKATKSGLFATTPGSKAGHQSPSPTSERFGLSASRVLTLYTMDKGFEVARRLCSTLPDLAHEDRGAILGPREGVWSALIVVKEVSVKCGDMFGSPKRAGPVPQTLEDEYPSLTAARQQQGIRSGLISDVERLFTEEVNVYPNPYEMLEPQRNAVIVLLLKIAFKALAEDTRSVRFCVAGYRQLLVDLELLKFMLPHYVADEHLSDGSNTLTVLENLLKDVGSRAKDRCDTSAMLNDPTSETNQARASVRQFMQGDNEIVRRFTIDDDEDTDGNEAVNI